MYKIEIPRSVLRGEDETVPEIIEGKVETVPDITDSED